MPGRYHLCVTCTYSHPAPFFQRRFRACPPLSPICPPCPLLCPSPSVSIRLQPCPSASQITPLFDALEDLWGLLGGSPLSLAGLLDKLSHMPLQPNVQRPGGEAREPQMCDSCCQEKGVPSVHVSWFWFVRSLQLWTLRWLHCTQAPLHTMFPFKTIANQVGIRSLLPRTSPKGQGSFFLLRGTSLRGRAPPPSVGGQPPSAVVPGPFQLGPWGAPPPPVGH